MKMSLYYYLSFIVTERQNVTHLGCGHILTFPPVGSNKLQVHINFSCCFIFKYKAIVHFKVMRGNISSIET